VQLDRRRGDEDVFEHVICGVRLNHVLQLLREMEVVVHEPEPDEPSEDRMTRLD
jgi:hypothetical protein